MRRARAHIFIWSTVVCTYVLVSCECTYVLVSCKECLGSLFFTFLHVTVALKLVRIFRGIVMGEPSNLTGRFVYQNVVNVACC